MLFPWGQCFCQSGLAVPLGPWDSVFSGKVFCTFFFFFKSPLFFSGFLQGLCICLLIAPSVWTKTLAFPCSPPFQILQFPEKGLPELQSPLVPKAPWAQCSAALACKDGTLASAGKRGTLGKTIMRRVLAAWNTQGMPAPR